MRLSAMTAIAVALASPALPSTTFFGTDPQGQTANTYAAFDAWVASVGSFSKDTIDGITPADTLIDSATTTGGSTFTAPEPNIYGSLVFQNLNVSVGTAPDFVIDGPVLGSTGQWQVGSTIFNEPIIFTWALPEASTAFGFFSYDHDGGEIGISFDGGAQTFTAQSDGTDNSDSNFWGISGLTTPVSEVTLSSTDPGIVYWDNFVYASPSAVIPLPGALPLLVTGLLAFGAVRRRRG